MTSIPGLAEIVVVYFHTKTLLVPQKGESVTSARSQIISRSSIGVGGTSTLFYMMSPLTLFDEAP